MDDRDNRRLNLFVPEQKTPDVLNVERLQKFLKKREEWLFCLNGDDQHSIWRQITSLLWDYALFKTIRELRVEATQNPTERIGFNAPVLRLLEAGFVITQATGIRRLLEKQWCDPTKHVISLRALLDEIKNERESLTREVYLACVTACLMTPHRLKRDFTMASCPRDKYFRMLAWIPAAQKRGPHRKGPISILINFPILLLLAARATI
jgi:hypothetical protein